MARADEDFHDTVPTFVDPSMPDDDAPAAAPPTPVAVLADAPRSQRSKPNPREQALSNLAHAWWRRLPRELQPHELCILYPRIANRIALCWGDSELTERLFVSLLVDTRGSRRGFPKVVLTELLALRELLGPAAEPAIESATASVPAPM